MDSSDAATPNGIELTTTNSAPPGNQRRVHVNVTFCTHVGWDGALVMLFSLGIAGLFVYITFLYTKSFQVWHRPWVWLFMVFAVLYTLLVVKFLCTWKKLASEFSIRQQAARKEKKVIKRTDSAIRRAQNAAIEAKSIFEKLQVNGPWFLWKLYLSELFESAQQCINLTNVYLCSLPVEWTVSICLGLSVDCLHAVWTMAHKNTPTHRDRQLKIDTTVDFLCVAIPLCVIWFVYKIPMSIPEMLFITLLPTFFMLGKLDDILEEVIQQHSALHVMQEQAKHSFKIKRRRESVFQHVLSVNMAKTQDEKMPRPVRLLAAGTKGVFGLFFFVVAVAHMVMRPTGCDKKTWETGCVNKIPFCKSLFIPTCNCASLRIVNDLTLTALPNSMVDEMTGLRKVFIRNCNLTKLPPRMEQLTEMVDFEISFNKLKAFHVDVLKWEKLSKLHLTKNNITQYNEGALWTHPNLAGIYMYGNVGMSMPVAGIYMPSLNFLHLGDNEITIDVPFEAESFPQLFYLFLNGNYLKAFPGVSLKGNLLFLGIARCNLISIPTYLSEFYRLQYLDARNNNITMVDDDLKELIAKNDVEAYFSGNMVCRDDRSLDCKPLCSESCWKRDVLNDGICDVTCNSRECSYDGGDCSFL